MSYTANQYNYCTPLSSTAGLVRPESIVADNKYFILGSNILDGSYVPVTGDVGLWGTVAADAAGNLSTAFVVTVVENLTINAFHLRGSQYSFPVDFTVEFYSGQARLYTITETANSMVEYTHYLPATLVVTSYVISITKISSANGVARLYNLYNPAYVKRIDTVLSKASEAADVYVQVYLRKADSLSMSGGAIRKKLSSELSSIDTVHVTGVPTSKLLVTIRNYEQLIIKPIESSTIVNTIDRIVDLVGIKSAPRSAFLNTIEATHDMLTTRTIESIPAIRNTIDVTTDTIKSCFVEEPTLTNVHTRMKEPSRQIYGKVYITYTDPMLDASTTFESNMEAYNSNSRQLVDGVVTTDGNYFTLYDNDLSGDYTVSDLYSQVGWVSKNLSDANGAFDIYPYVKITFAARPVQPLTVYFDDSHDSVPMNFTVEITKEDTTSYVHSITDNTSRSVQITTETISDVVSVMISVSKVTKAGTPATVLEIPVLSTILYEGLKEHSDLINIDLLEELTYDDDVEAIGGMSANEITVALDNSDREFFFNNPDSLVAKRLQRNRKIEPWLGVEIIQGTIEWYPLGTYWSYSWDVPVDGLIATVVGFDTIGLLGTTSYSSHQVQINKSLGQLIECVLNDAKQTFVFLDWSIDAALYDIIIPYAWFDNSSHAAALRKISTAYPMHIYCDRKGTICAAPQRLRLDYYYDIWSDSTNVISKTYSSLHTAVPNIVNVTVYNVSLLQDESLATDNFTFSVPEISTRTLTFNKPYVSDITISVDKDASVAYTYTVYSWGISFEFTGYGNVRSISCVGTALDNSNSAVITNRNEDSIKYNGAITRDIQADFIQSSSLALSIISRFVELSSMDKYDAEVTYRGDISLSINDAIQLLNGIAPDNRYTIKRHQLHWDGALSGSADLNT